MILIRVTLEGLVRRARTVVPTDTWAEWHADANEVLDAIDRAARAPNSPPGTDPGTPAAQPRRRRCLNRAQRVLLAALLRSMRRAERR